MAIRSDKDHKDPFEGLPRGGNLSSRYVTVADKPARVEAAKKALAVAEKTLPGAKKAARKAAAKKGKRK